MGKSDKPNSHLLFRQENISIASKGFFLIATPIVSSLIFLTALLFLVQQSEHEAWREAQGKALLAEINTLSGQFVDCSEAMVLYQILKSQKALSRYEQSAAQIPQQMHRLRQLALLMPNESRRKYVFEVSRLSDKGLRILEQSRNCLSSEGALLNTLETRKTAEELKDFLNEFVESIKQLNRQEQHAELEGILLVGQSRKQLQMVIITGFVITILLAFFLHHFFAKNLLSRLELMVENTKLLAQHKPMNSPLSGTDEISQLDHSFHEMARSLEELEQLKRQFLSTVSHDLRTPISSVRMTHDLLLEGYLGELGPEVHDKLKSASKTLDRLLQMINRLLDLEKMEQANLALNLETISATELFATTMENISDLLSASKLALYIEPTEIQLRCDRELILQVLINLVGNAMKFAPPESTITLRAVASPNGIARISVIDHGPGIPKEYLDIIFERFKQVKGEDAKRGGLGLGLPICKSIIQAHGMEIGVHSEVGSGSEFWFSLPQVKHEATQPAF